MMLSLSAAEFMAWRWPIILPGMLRKRVALFEKSYLGSGASGRNGEMIRSAFGSREWIGLWDKSLKLWEDLAAELDFNVMFTRHGYLILATNDKEFENLKQNWQTQQEFGLATEILDAEEVLRLIPDINPDMVAGGLLQTNAGFARHDAAIWGYARAARRLKADIFPFTEATGIVVEADRVRAVKTSRGEVETPIVVNTAGAHDRSIAQMAGLDLPTEVRRVEIMVTEPLKPFLPKAVSAPGLTAYMHQSARGEFIGGASEEDVCTLHQYEKFPVNDPCHCPHLCSAFSALGRGPHDAAVDGPDQPDAGSRPGHRPGAGNPGLSAVRGLGRLWIYVGPRRRQGPVRIHDQRPDAP